MGLLEISQNLIHHRFGDSPEKEEFSKIILNIRDAAPIRNKIVHGQWHESDKPGITHHWDFNWRKRIEVSVRPIEDKEIFGWAEGIAKITLALTIFYDDHLAEPPPSPDKP